MIINRCWQCMEDLGTRETCPHCGFDPEKKPPVPYALKPGTILHGKYVVGNMLGRGGYGITYIGFDMTLEMKVAIKEYFPVGNATRNNQNGNALLWRQSDSDTSWRSGCIQFLSEARKMARINAISEIVSVRDTFEENNTAYIVMDYVPGTTLKAYLQKNGCLSFAECVKLLSPVIAGLDKVHRQGIIHRDISPDNLMLTPEGKVYLLDLGAAKDMKNPAAQDIPASKRGFSPLEQGGAANTLGAWTDVYSLAASIYYCVYGKVIPSAMERFQEDTLTFTGKTKVPLTKEQIAVLKKGLALNREFRYQTAMEFLIALEHSVKKKRSGKWIAAIAGVAVAAVAAVAGIWVAKEKPWLPTVEVYGNYGPFCVSNFAIVEKQYEYFIDLDQSLVCVPYNEAGKTFYLDQAQVIYQQDDAIEGDSVGALNVTEDTLYAVYYGGMTSSGEEKSGYLLAMDLDGSNQRKLLEIPHDATTAQYVKLSNGEEYFYYMMTDAPHGEDYHIYLYRYDVQQDKLEQPVDTEIQWYGLYGKYLYYSVWEESSEDYLLYRATLAGEDPKLVDDTHNYWSGVIADGNFYLMQSTTKDGDFSIGLVPCDENAQPITEGNGVFGIDWLNSDWTIGGGWIYYTEDGSDQLYRVRLDGTGKSLLYEGYQYEHLCYSSGSLYFQDGTTIDEEFHPYQAYLAGADGSWTAACNFSMSALTDSQGVQYVIQDGYANLVGYVGTSAHVIIPLEFNGYPVNDRVNSEKFVTENIPFSDLHFYALMRESELSYKKTADGITITGYSGHETGDIQQVAIPSEIEGTPVVSIGEGAFTGCTFKRVYLPTSLVEIQKEAFDECSNLIGVVFPDTLKSIGYAALRGCSFEGENVVLPDGLEKIDTAFMWMCAPESVYIPASVTSIGNGFLAGCSGEYLVDPDNAYLDSVNGVVFNKSHTAIYAFPYEKTGSYSVPSGVTTIKPYAFYVSNLTKVTLPSSVTEIGEYAFKASSKLTSVNIPYAVKTIGKEAFCKTALTSVQLRYGTEGKNNAFDENVAITYYNES